MGEDKNSDLPIGFLLLNIGIIIIHITASLFIGSLIGWGCDGDIIFYDSASNFFLSLYFISPAILLSFFNRMILRNNFQKGIIAISILFVIYIATNILFSRSYYNASSYCGGIIQDIIPLVIWNIGSAGLFFMCFIPVGFLLSKDKNKISLEKLNYIENMKQGEGDD